jgi:hypothetical protein
MLMAVCVWRHRDDYRLIAALADLAYASEEA